MTFRQPMKVVLVAAGLGLSAFVQSAFAAGTASAGQAKAGVCIACHGVDGNSVNPEWPSLAGQHANYIVKQIKAFKNGDRKNTLMSPMALPLSDQDMEDLAAYYAAQTAKGLEADKAKYQAGEKIYRGGNKAGGVAACIACHGPNGRGNAAASYPSLRGQHSKYVETQLMAYKSGERLTDKAQNQMMHDTAKRLSNEEIAAVAAYIQGLR